MLNACVGSMCWVHRPVSIGPCPSARVCTHLWWLAGVTRAPTAEEALYGSAVEKATEYKAAGNAKFKAGDLNGAMREYHCGHMETRSVMVKKAGLGKRLA